MQLLRKIAFPISLIYAAVVHVRNFLFDVGIFKSKSYKTPIIGIGNLSLGGTGKTPMAEFLISSLKNEYKVAFLSRGYRRRSKGFVLGSQTSTVEDLGDEPFQILSKFPDIDVAVDADRRNGISIIENKIMPDVIILDDAFQHRRVKPGYSLLLTTYGNLYCDDWYFPTGTLRDGKREALRADHIVVTKCPTNLTKGDQARIIEKLAPKNHQKVLFSFLEYAPTIKAFEVDYTWDDLRNKSITLVTGIADPKPLLNYLEDRSIPFQHISFNDHHFFSPSELQMLNTKELVLTTEKDFVRLKGKVKNLAVVAMGHAFLSGGEASLLHALKDFMKRHP